MTEPKRRVRRGLKAAEVSAALRPLQTDISTLSRRAALLRGKLQYGGTRREADEDEALAIFAGVGQARNDLHALRDSSSPALASSTHFDDLLRSLETLSAMVMSDHQRQERVDTPEAVA